MKLIEQTYTGFCHRQPEHRPIKKPASRLWGLLGWLAVLTVGATSWSAQAASVPIVSWEYDQVRPAVAFNPKQGEYLVVWEDHHWGFGDDWDIYARRVAANGSPLGAHFGVAWVGANKRLAPDVAYNPDREEFLVVWEYEYSSTDHDIHGQRVKTDGSLVGGQIAITTALNYESQPAVAYDPDQKQYLVVWQRREGADEFVHFDIYGQRLNGDGTLSGNPIAIATSGRDEAAADVAYATGNATFLVVWQGKQPATTEYGVYGQVLNASGSLVGSLIGISVWEYDQLRPRVAFNSQRGEFLVVWEDHHWGWGANWDIYGQRLHPAGPLLGGNFGISWEDQEPAEDRIHPDVAYDPASGGYWVVWGFATTITQRYVGYRQLASDGTLLGNEGVFAATASPEVRPAVAVGAQGDCLLVWEDTRNAATQMIDLYGEVVTATGSKLDLQVGHVELTQGIQCMDNPHCPDNAVPLLAGKPTYLRVYVKVTGVGTNAPPLGNVSARAVAYVPGGSALAIPLNATIIPKLVPQRSQFGDTLNFCLPSSLVASSGQLEVEVNPEGTVPELNLANNKKMVPLNFVTTPVLNVVPVRLLYKYGTNNHVVDAAMPSHMSPYLKNLLPIGALQWHYLPGPPLEWTNQIGPGGSGWGEVLAKLADLKKKNSSQPADAQWYAMLPFAQVGGHAGLAVGTGGYVSMGRVPLQHENLEDAADIMAHELAHNFGRPHAPCGVTPADANYPYPNARIGDFGWDPQGAAGGKVQALPNGWVVPNTTADVMSYCQDEWISEYTYRAILNYRGYTAALTMDEAATLVAVPPTATSFKEATGPYLFVTGLIHLRGGQPVPMPMPWTILDRRLGFDDEPGGFGRCQLLLLDARGRTLFVRQFEPHSAIAQNSTADTLLGEEPSTFLYSQAMPWNPETAVIRLLWEGTPIEERAVSPRAPSVQVQAPARWSSTGEYRLTFTGQDPDGDTLTYDVEFSADGGASWRLFANNLTATQLVVRGDQFPGTANGLLRVWASDGIRSGVATTGLLSIESKPPRAILISPEDTANLRPDSPVWLRGAAYDPEDGELGPTALTWHSSRDGFLGTGSELLVQLAPGTHALTLTATDSQRNVATATIRVTIGFRILSIAIVPGQGPMLTWESAPGRTYRVLALESLTEPGVDVSGPLTAGDFQTTWVHGSAVPAHATRFYRVQDTGE